MKEGKIYLLNIQIFRLLSIRCISNVVDEISIEGINGFVKSSMLEAAYQLKIISSNLQN